MNNQPTNTDNKKTNQTFVGVIVSDKMKDSALVAVKKYKKHPKYKKFMTRITKLMVHNPGNLKKVGDTVTVVACRPLSKRKAFKIID